MWIQFEFPVVPKGENEQLSMLASYPRTSECASISRVSFVHAEKHCGSFKSHEFKQFLEGLVASMPAILGTGW
jgi:hypothetical protein